MTDHFPITEDKYTLESVIERFYVNEVFRENYSRMDIDDLIIEHARDGFINPTWYHYGLKEWVYAPMEHMVADHYVWIENADCEPSNWPTNEIYLSKEDILAIEKGEYTHYTNGQVEPNLDEDNSEGMIKKHGNSKVNAEKRQSVINAAKKVINDYPEQCKTKSTQIVKASKVANLLYDKSLLYWSGTGEPPVTVRTMEKYIREWLKEKEKITE